MELYAGVVIAAFLVGVLAILSILVLDAILIKKRHVPGVPVEGSHSDLAFRASRVIGNLNESIAAFVVLVLAAVWLNASPAWVNGMALLYAVSRWLYAFAYYFNFKRSRSIIFGFAIGALIILAVVVGIELFITIFR